jgi:hypothetical protein
MNREVKIEKARKTYKPKGCSILPWGVSIVVKRSDMVGVYDDE